MKKYKKNSNLEKKCNFKICHFLSLPPPPLSPSNNHHHCLSNISFSNPNLTHLSEEIVEVPLNWEDKKIT